MTLFKRIIIDNIRENLFKSVLSVFQFFILNSFLDNYIIQCNYMGEKNKTRSKKINNPRSTVNRKFNQEKKKSLLPPVFLLIAITALCMFPMLKNGFTNWDDEYYVINNALLRGPDWAGIFTQPVVSNYHPLTVISLEFNYAISGTD